MLASGRTCTGRMRKEGDPPWGRAEPDLPRGALGPWPRDFGTCGGRPSPAANALSAFARTRRDAGTGEAAARMPGNAPSCAKNPGGGRPWSDRCEGSAQHRVNRAPLARPPATVLGAANLLDGRARVAQSRCRPALERLRKRPSRTGRGEGRIGARSLSRTFFCSSWLMPTMKISRGRTSVWVACHGRCQFSRHIDRAAMAKKRYTGICSTRPQVAFGAETGKARRQAPRSTAVFEHSLIRAWLKRRYSSLRCGPIAA